MPHIETTNPACDLPKREVNWNCRDCKVDVQELNEYYSLKNSVWLSVAGKHEMLCIGCVEKRLGRLLTEEDFMQCPLNSTFPIKRSDRLIGRLGGLLSATHDETS